MSVESVWYHREISRAECWFAPAGGKTCAAPITLRYGAEAAAGVIRLICGR